MTGKIDFGWRKGRDRLYLSGKIGWEEGEKSEHELSLELEVRDIPCWIIVSEKERMGYYSEESPLSVTSHHWKHLNKGIIWQKLHLRNINVSGVCRLYLQDRREIAGRNSNGNILQES